MFAAINGRASALALRVPGQRVPNARAAHIALNSEAQAVAETKACSSCSSQHGVRLYVGMALTVCVKCYLEFQAALDATACVLSATICISRARVFLYCRSICICIECMRDAMTQVTACVPYRSRLCSLLCRQSYWGSSHGPGEPAGVRGYAIAKE